MEYVVGFLLSNDLKRVALMNKTGGPYPGMLNGLGGKVEPGESVSDAMLRELKEETNGQIMVHNLDKAFSLVAMFFPTGATVHCYGMVLAKDMIWGGCMHEEGEVTWYDVADVLDVTDQRLAGDGNIPYLINATVNIAGRQTEWIKLK